MPTAPQGLWIGTIKAVDGGRCRITIPTLAGDRVWTSVRFVIPIGGPDAAVGDDEISVGEEGSLALRPLQVDDQVLVGFLQGSRDHPVILGRLS